MKPNPLIAQKWHQNKKKRGDTSNKDDTRKEEELQQWTILVRPERCTGCGACVSACAARRDHMGDRKMSSIRVMRFETGNVIVPLSCWQCREGSCLSVCPGDVLSREGDYAIIGVDEARCTSCGSCLFSCPYEVLHIGGRRLTAEPCDLCSGDALCVAACTAGALEFIEMTEDVLDNKRRLSERLKEMGEEILPNK